MSDKVLLSVQGKVGWLEFNRPEKRNALTIEMMAKAREIVENLSSTGEIRTLVIKGCENQPFSSGADVAELTDNPEVNVGPMTKLVLAMAKAPFPIIGMIRGYAMSAGLEVAAFCDLRVAESNARFAIPSARLGTIVGVEFVRRLVYLIGHACAEEMLFTGKTFSAAWARQAGLLNEVVPEGELDSYVANLADEIARNAPLSLHGIKQICWELYWRSRPSNLEDLNLIVEKIWRSHDFAEGKRAFFERRLPHFIGQ